MTLPSPPSVSPAGTPSDAVVKHMVNRFLMWKLPENFHPDDGISFNPLSSAGTPHERRREPTGTNLLDAEQATAMVRYMLDGFAAAPPPPAPERRVTLGIYIASKTVHAPRWRILRDTVGEPVVSTWIDEAGEGETADYNDLWLRCLGEAASAAITIVYHERSEVLKGALVEVGAALSHGRTVIVVGDPDGSWVQSAQVIRVATMRDAIAKSRKLLAALAAESTP